MNDAQMAREIVQGKGIMKESPECECESGESCPVYSWVDDEAKLIYEITKALATARSEGYAKGLSELYEKVMSLDNRVGTATTMQYDVRNLIEKMVKSGGS